MKKVLSIHRGGERHWVGDGFPVRTSFHYQELGSELTPKDLGITVHEKRGRHRREQERRRELDAAGGAELAE